MPITLVAATSAGLGANGGTTAGLNTTGADLLVVSVASYLAGGAVSVSDSRGHTWTALTERTGPNNTRVRVYYAAAAVGGAGHTVTVSGTGIYAAVAVLALAGADTAAPFDQQNGAGGTGTALACGSVTPTTAGQVVVAGLGYDTAVSGLGVDSGLTSAGHAAYANGVNFGAAIAYLVQGAAAAVDPQWSWTPSAPAAAAVATFKAASGGTPVTGTAAGTLDGVTGAAVGTLAITGAAGGTLAGVTGGATGVVGDLATLAPSVDLVGVDCSTADLVGVDCGTVDLTGATDVADPTPQTFRHPAGADRVLRVTMTAPPAGGVSGWAVRFRLFTSAGAVAKTLGAGVEIDNAVTGVWLVTLTDTDTDGLPRRLHGWDFWRTDDGSERPIAYGSAALYATD